MADEAFQALLTKIAEARKQGKSMEQMFEMANEFLASQPPDYADSKRDELMRQVKMLQSQAPLLEQLMNIAKTGGDHMKAVGTLLQMHANLQAAQTPEEKAEEQRRREDGFARMAKAQEEMNKRRALHRQERIKRGLLPEAGTGKPESRLMLMSADDIDLDLDDEQQHSGLGAMIKSIEAAKQRRDAKVLEQLPIGASRVGGLPDLPRGVGWPTHEKKKLPFLAQIDLAEVSKLTQAKKGMLPADGWLYAFGLISNDKKHWPPPMAVIVQGAARSALVRAKRPKDAEIWPDWGKVSVYETVPVTVAPKDAKPKKKRRGATAGWLFGKMDEVFGTPGEIADSDLRDGDDWINLLALHSVGSMQWSDAGHLYLLIRRSHLAEGDFSQVIGRACSS